MAELAKLGGGGLLNSICATDRRFGEPTGYHRLPPPLADGYNIQIESCLNSVKLSVTDKDPRTSSAHDLSASGTDDPRTKIKVKQVDTANGFISMKYVIKCKLPVPQQ